MSSLKTKLKQMLTTLLALAMLLAMAPILPGGLAYAEDNIGTYISIEKPIYEYTPDPEFLITASYDNAEGSKWPWVGVFSGDLNESSSFSDPEVYAYLDETAKHGSHQGTQFNILGSGQYYGYSPKHNDEWTFPVGKYTVALFEDDDYTSCVEVVHFEIVEAENPVVESITIDKTKYSVGESVMVSATSAYANAWVGLYPHPGGDPLDNGDLKNWYYVKDTAGEDVDILHDDEIVQDIDENLKAGRYKVILFTSGYNIDTDEDDNLLMKFFWIGEYENPIWTWNEDHTKATATFTEKDDSAVTASTSIATITSVENEATCVAAANTTYTATLAAEDVAFLTVGGETFTGTDVVESGDPLGHAWGDWEMVTPATTESEGLEKRVCSRCQEAEERAIPKIDHIHSPTLVEAVAATCETTGNEAYYVCECGKMFSDAEAQNEIDAIPTIPAKGHAYGDWVYDADNKQHVKTCANDPSHKVSEVCTFDEGVVEDDIKTYTCTVCGGTYTQSTVPVITTDKTSYKYGEDIFVTTELNGEDGTTSGVWVALQYKDEAYNKGSLLWYYPALFNNPKKLQSIFTPVNTDWENVNGGRGTDKWSQIPAGEYELVFLKGSNYERVGQPAYFTVYYEYNDPTWTWAENGSSATATFVANGKEDATETVTDDAPTKVEKTPATCTEGGVDTYTATVTVDFATVSGEKKFSDSKDVATEKLGHSWSEWTEVTPATEIEEGLESRECSRCHDTESRAIPVISHTHKLTEHPAAEATCVATGNSAYWVCNQGENPCGKYFSDEEGTKEIEENSWIIPKSNEHDYGDWEFDGADKKTHTKTCSRDESHKVTEACAFEDTEEDGAIKHTCSVCGGSYITPIALSTDKDTYKLSEPIMVTVNYEGDNNAWVGLYGKDETPNPNQNPASIYWYYIEGNSTYDLTKGTKNREYGAGEYKIILFGDGGFSNIIATKNITLTDVGPSDISIDATSYSMGDPVMVTATSDYPNAWVGLYDYNNSEPLDTTLLSYYLLSDSDGEPVDIFNGDIVKDKEKLENLPAGKYKVILFTSGYDIDHDSQGDLAIRSFDLKDNSECNHDWGDWEFNSENKTHTRTCKINSSHKETKPCAFDDGVPSSDPGVYTYTCTVCGGQYEQVKGPAITTNKKEYELGEDILVTTELNGENGTTSGGWIALYEKGSGPTYDTSLLWYFPAEFDNPKALQSVLTPSDTNKENMGDWPESWGDTLPAGEYELVFLKGSKPYTSEYQPTYFSVVRGIESETVTKEPTCTEIGIKRVKYKDGAVEDVEIDPLGHDPKEEWTYIAEEKAHYHACSRCDEILDKTACTFDEGTVTKDPTAKEEGEMTYTCTVCGGKYTEAIPTLEESGVKRVYGSTRYQTAILQANELKALLKVDKFDAVIVATGENFADALSGAYLGYVKKAPILLVNKGSVNEVKDYIRKNLASGGTIYLLGGEAVVPDDVIDGMSEFVPKRLFGATRYETNIEILKEAGVKREEMMICDGTNFADSLSASAARRPILLVNKSLNQIQRDYLDNLRTQKYYLIGGTGVLSEALEKDISENFGSTMRLGGQDRFETSVKVAETLFKNSTKAVLAYGMNYPDGLCGGTLAAYMGDGAPLLLVRDDKAATTTGYTSAKGIKSGIVLGGPTLIADNAARSIFELEAADEIYVVSE